MSIPARIPWATCAPCSTVNTKSRESMCRVGTAFRFDLNDCVTDVEGPLQFPRDVLDALIRACSLLDRRVQRHDRPLVGERPGMHMVDPVELWNRGAQGFLDLFLIESLGSALQ